MEKKEFTSQFKARLALKALEQDRSLRELEREYGVPAILIEQWTDRIRTHSETLFMEGGSAVDPKSNGKGSLRDHLSLLRATLDGTTNGILVVDLEGRITIYNNRFLELWNIPEHVISGEKDEIAVNYVLDQLSSPEKFRQRIEVLYDNPGTTSNDELLLKDGRIFKRHTFPQRLGGTIVGRVWSFQDITETRRTHKKMHRFGRLLKSINANVTEGILRSTPSEGLVYVNDAFVKMFGYDSKEEALSVAPEQYYADEDQRWALVNELEKYGSISNIEVLYKRKDGSTFWGLENCTMVEANGQQFIDGVILDVTERREVEHALRQSEEKYRTIIQNIEDGYFETDLKGNLTFFNEAMQRMLGYAREELLAMDKKEFMDLQNIINLYKTFRNVYRTGESERGFDCEIITRDNAIRFVEASIAIKRDAEGKPTGFRGIARDITERKRHENQIERSLKEKEVLLGEIHHRVKNNLAVISGLLYLQADQTVDKTARSLLKQSQSRIHSMAMVHELLYDTKSFSSISPEAYIRKLVEYISNNLDHGKTDIGTEVVTGNIQLHMNESIPCALIINELLTNAYKYAFEGREQGQISIRFEPAGDDNYRLEVADDGIGFEQAPDLTRDTGEGLGLYLVNTLVKQIRGEIELDIDNGTRFTITFPHSI